MIVSNIQPATLWSGWLLSCGAGSAMVWTPDQYWRLDLGKSLNLQTLDLGASASSSDVIHDALRTAITRGEIGEGQTLRQDSIAKMFNVSRIPVREALKRLEAQGLVTSVRYKGVVVTPLSQSEIEEIFQFRALIEPELLKFSVPNMTEQSLDHAQSLCDAFANEEDASRWGDLNRLFHSSLYVDAGKHYFSSVVAGANDRIERYIRAQLIMTYGRQRAIAEHQMIVDACRRGDAQAAADITRDHILQASRSLIEVLSRRE